MTEPNIPTPDQVNFLNFKKKYISLSLIVARNLLQEEVGNINLPINLLVSAIFKKNLDQPYQFSMNKEFVWESMLIFAKSEEFKSIQSVSFDNKKLTLRYQSSSSIHEILISMIGSEADRLNFIITPKHQNTLMGVFESRAGDLVEHLSFKNIQTMREYNLGYNQVPKKSNQGDKVAVAFKNIFEIDKVIELNISKQSFTSLLTNAVDGGFIDNIDVIDFDWQANKFEILFKKYKPAVNFEIVSFNENNLVLKIQSSLIKSLSTIAANTPVFSILNFIKILKLELFN